jgi:plasmid maintenance system antidote protein VapI
VIWHFGKAEYFFKRGWTRLLQNSLTGKSLARAGSNSAQFWLDLQGQDDIGVVEREKGAEISRRVRSADAA